jgi:hypothetical protein
MDPFTIAAGISAIGSLFKGVTGFLGGNRQASAERRAAEQAEAEGGVAAQQAVAQGDQVAAQGAVNAAANGGGFTGSALASISQLSQQALFNARAAAYRGVTEAQSHLYQAKVAKQQGLQDLVGGAIDAGASLYGGVARSGAEAKQLAALKTLRNDAPVPAY